MLCSSEDAQCCILPMYGCATQQRFDCHSMKESACRDKYTKPYTALSQTSQVCVGGQEGL